MANYAELKAEIAAAIYPNDQQEIDAVALRDTLDAMVDALGDGYLFKGAAALDTDPGTPDTNVFYVASAPGTYNDFDNLTVSAGEVAFFCYDGTWSKVSSGALSTSAIADNLTTNDATKVLSAKQGKVLKDLLAEGYLYAGVAVLTPTATNPGTPAGKVFYLATQPGTYANFGNQVVNVGEVALFKCNGGTWTKDSLYDMSNFANAAEAPLVLDSYSPPLVRGSYWRFTDGTQVSNNKYARSQYRLGGIGYRNAIEMTGDTYTYSLVYEEGSTIVGTKSMGSGVTIFPKNAQYVKINFKRVDDAVLTDADMTAISAALRLYKITDASLTMNAFPADAKATGEAIGKVNTTADSIIRYLLNELDFVPTLIRGSYWAFADGSIVESANFIRTYRLFGAGQRSAIKLTDPDYLYSIVYENANKEVVGTKDPTTGLTFFPEDAYFVCVNFKRADGSAVTVDDVAAIAADVKFYSSARESNTGEDTTDNLFDVSSFTQNVDKVAYTIYGTAAQLDGKVLLDISDRVGGVYNFEWDYKNNGGVTSSVGPCVVALDENGDPVNVESVTTGASVAKILLSNFRDFVHRSFAYKFPATAKKIVLGINGEPDDTTYYFRGVKITRLPKEAVRKMPDFYPHWSYADHLARLAAQSAGFIHDGAILQMSDTPQAIPVGENHLGYDAFIAATWDTLLPDGYEDGDAYNENTTKIHGVHVERESRWESTPYGVNTDTYTIYRYTFTPQSGYDKTLFLTSGCHGNEAEGYWGLFRLVRMIYFEGYKYPALRNLRNTRLIIVPSWNPWGLQHYRRYNAFSALNTGGTDVAKGLQAWSWLIAPTHQKTVEGVVYDITDVGEANVIWETLNEYAGAISLWVDFHTDPYAGRDTSDVDIDDPRGYTPPYGCYGYAPENSRAFVRMFGVMEDFFNIMRDRYSFAESWHPRSTTPNSTNSFTGWQSTLGIPCALVEISTFMDDFPYASGSGEMMRIAQEFYGNCIAEMLR